FASVNEAHEQGPRLASGACPLTRTTIPGVPGSYSLPFLYPGQRSPFSPSRGILGPCRLRHTPAPGCDHVQDSAWPRLGFFPECHPPAAHRRNPFPPRIPGCPPRCSVPCQFFPCSLRTGSGEVAEWWCPCPLPIGLNTPEYPRQL